MTAPLTIAERELSSASWALHHRSALATSLYAKGDPAAPQAVAEARAALVRFRVCTAALEAHQNGDA